MRVDLDLRVAQDGGSSKTVGLRQACRWKRCAGLALTAVALSCTACGRSTPTVLVAFRTEEQAQAHCPKDTVVWIDPQNAMYYLKGHGKYGSIAGRYACRDEADEAGIHGGPS
jgi:hypothetical protein